MVMQNLQSLISSSGVKSRDRKASGSKNTIASHVYTTNVDCDGSTTSSIYKINDNIGSYDEDLCGTVYNGMLGFIENTTVQLDIAIDGWVYAGTDSSGVYGYFFSKHEVPELGSYVVLLSEPHTAGQPFEPITGWTATRA